MDANSFTASWLAEDAPIVTARGRAQDVGITAVAPAVGSMLAVLAAMVGARTVVETGTGTGVSGLWLLRGMTPAGVLTSIDAEPEHQRLARSAFHEAGIPAARARLITGAALEVLPRLADHGYDLVLIDAAPADFPGQVEQGWRLLRPGGVVAVSGVLRGGRAAEANARDAEAMAIRELLAAVAVDEAVSAALLPIGDGLLVLFRAG